MGVVHRASHVDTGEPVAVKVLLEEEVRKQEKRRDFRREIQVLAKLNHPSIASVVDYGPVGVEAAESGPDPFALGAPWFAMEYVDGSALHHAISSWNWRTLKSILLSVLDALAHAHARSFVHRDLKPSNILLERASDASKFRVKLVDFGVARRIVGDTATRGMPERVLGTPSYMAPEQIRGNWRDQGPWTDLYALGCLAWRLACGASPVDAEDTQEMLEAQLREKPPEFEPRFPVPAGFEGWIRDLLRKEVDSRLGRCADAAWQLMRLEIPDDGAAEAIREGAEPSTSTAKVQPTLASIAESLPSTGNAAPDKTAETAAAGPGGGSSGEERTAPLPTISEGQPPVMPDWKRRGTSGTAVVPKAGLGLFGLREAPFMGRRHERDELWEELRRVRSEGAPELITIGGLAGTGKSRLVHWFARRADETGTATVFRAKHVPSPGSNEGLRGMFRRNYRTADLSRPEVFERLLEKLPSRGPSDDMRLVDARGLTEFLRPTDESDEEEGPSYRFAGPGQRYALLARVLERHAAERPLVVHLDDLHWGRETVAFLEEVFGRGPEIGPVLFVGTIRSDVVADEPELRERLEELRGRAEADRLELGPMDPDAHRALVDRLLHLAPEVAERVTERTEGHPLFAIQLLRHWIQSEKLEAAPEGFRIPEGSAPELPSDIHQLWRGRIDRLVDSYPEEQRAEVLEVVESAAALGREIVQSEWEELLERIAFDAGRELVESLVERGLARRTAEGWSFAHGMLVDSLEHRSRTAGRWARHNRRCARVLGRQLGDRPGPRERMAEHWIDAGEPERALEPLLEESRMYSRRSDDEERSRVLGRRAQLLAELDVSREDRAWLEQRVESADLSVTRGNSEAAREALVEIWESCDDEPDKLRARIALIRSESEVDYGNLAVSKEWARRALALSRRAGDVGLQSEVLRRLSNLEYYAGNLEAAGQYAREAHRTAERADDRYGAVDALLQRAWVLASRGSSASNRLFERARQEAEEAGYVGLEARLLNVLGESARFDGRLDEARKDYLEFLRKSRELGRPRGRVNAHLNLALVDIGSGAFERAAEHLQTAEALLRDLGLGESLWTLRELIHLAVAAGRGDDEEFRARWSPLEDDWSDSATLQRDHAWILEVVGERAEEQGWDERAGRARVMAERFRSRLEGEGEEGE